MARVSRYTWRELVTTPVDRWIERRVGGQTVTYLPGQRIPGRLEVSLDAAPRTSGRPATIGGQRVSFIRPPGTAAAIVLGPGDTFVADAPFKSLWVRLLPGDGLVTAERYGRGSPVPQLPDLSGGLVVGADLRPAHVGTFTAGQPGLEPDATVDLLVGDKAVVRPGGAPLRAGSLIVPALRAATGSTLVREVVRNVGAGEGNNGFPGAFEAPGVGENEVIAEVPQLGDLLTRYELRQYRRATLWMGMRPSEDGLLPSGFNQRVPRLRVPHGPVELTVTPAEAGDTDDASARFYHLGQWLARTYWAVAAVDMGPPDALAARLHGSVHGTERIFGRWRAGVELADLYCVWVLDDGESRPWEVLQASLTIESFGLDPEGSYAGCALPVAGRRAAHLEIGQQANGVAQLWHQRPPDLEVSQFIAQPQHTIDALDLTGPPRHVVSRTGAVKFYNPHAEDAEGFEQGLTVELGEYAPPHGGE